jgi:hypothetical protein
MLPLAFWNPIVDILLVGSKVKIVLTENPKTTGSYCSLRSVRRSILSMKTQSSLREPIFLAFVLVAFCSSFTAAQTENSSEYAVSNTVVAVQPAEQPISRSERVAWFVNSIVAPKSLAAGVFSSAWNTAVGSPKDYGPHWQGFGKRYGMRLTQVATGNAIEGGLGAVWGEDPRYFRSTENRPLRRLRHAAIMTFVARRPDGHLAPAFARYTAIVSNNFISNSWRVPSDSGTNAALTRSGLEFAGVLASNVFDEFWQDIYHRLRRIR